MSLCSGRNHISLCCCVAFQSSLYTRPYCFGETNSKQVPAKVQNKKPLIDAELFSFRANVWDCNCNTTKCECFEYAANFISITTIRISDATRNVKYDKPDE